MPVDPTLVYAREEFVSPVHHAARRGEVFYGQPASILPFARLQQTTFDGHATEINRQIVIFQLAENGELQMPELGCDVSLSYPVGRIS